MSAANLLGHSTGGTFERDASVGSKLFVTLRFVFRFHVIKRIARERTRRFKLPVTFGATEALKILALNRTRPANPSSVAE